MSDENITSERRLLLAVLAAFTLMAALAAVDVVSDLREGTTPSHVMFEGVIFLVGFAGGALVARQLVAATRLARTSSAEAGALAGQLARSEAEAERWRAEAHELLQGLSRAVDEQFERWQLTAAEKEVGLLLLKGLSHKEIASVRSVTEPTARQQARSVYKKAGLTGRHELAAFFLEDLMVPDGRSEK